MADKIDEAFEKWWPYVLERTEHDRVSLEERAFRAGFEACRAAALEALPKRAPMNWSSPNNGNYARGQNDTISAMTERLTALGKEPR